MRNNLLNKKIQKKKKEKSKNLKNAVLFEFKILQLK